MTLEEKIIYDYTVEDLNMTDIQKKYNIGYKKVRNALDNNNISRHIMKGRSNKKNQRILSKEEEEKVCSIYKETGKAADCEKAISAGQEVIRRCLQKYGLYRTSTEAVRQSPQNQQKYWTNNSFFSTESKEMAYIMGFIAADGSIAKNSNTIKIGLSAIDKDFLESIRKIIGGHPVKTVINNKGFEVSTWSCCSKQIKDDLEKYGIVPQKTFSLKFPKNLNKKYWIDFIRGYFDGDGCVSTAGAHAIRWQLCSATKNILEVIINFFEEEYKIPKVSIQEREGNNPLYTIQYSSVSTRKIYDFLYSEDCLFLPRKKEKFQKICDKI